MFCVDHDNDINRFYDDIVLALTSASSACIPKYEHSKGKNKNITGWIESVDDKRQTSLFWHYLWKDNGSPHNGIIAEIARRTRANYHYAIRNVLKNQNKLR